jgi:hypothetical protein
VPIIALRSIVTQKLRLNLCKLLVTRQRWTRFIHRAAL